MFVVIYSELSY